MGNYIYHKKATLKKPAKLTTNTHILSDLESDQYSVWDVPFSYFEKYFQIVETIKLVDSILILDTYEEFNAEKLRLPASNVFHQSEQNLIENFITAKSYRNIWLETERMDGRTIISLYERKSGKGFYTEEIFESPFKDCDPNFYETYSSANYYTRFEVFEKACNLKFNEWKYKSQVEFEHDVQVLRQYLIEQYEAGRSILYYC